MVKNINKETLKLADRLTSYENNGHFLLTGGGFEHKDEDIHDLLRDNKSDRRKIVQKYKKAKKSFDELYPLLEELDNLEVALMMMKQMNRSRKEELERAKVVARIKIIVDNIKKQKLVYNYLDTVVKIEGDVIVGYN